MKPDFIIHYSRGEPFRSISELSAVQLSQVLPGLDDSNSWGLNRFSDPEYLARRLQVEERMRQDFVNKGGMPELRHPIYFFLGENAQFEENKKNVGYRISLRDISPEVLSFTYGDSMFSMCENYRQKLGSEYLSQLCSQVYRLDELNHLLSIIRSIPFKLHIECQLWIEPKATMYIGTKP